MTIPRLSLTTLLGGPRRPVALPSTFMEAGNRRFTHPDPALCACKARVPMYGGELDLWLWRLPRTPDHDLADFAASWLCHSYGWGDTTVSQELLDENTACDPEFPPGVPTSTTSIGLLFEVTDMGCLMWDWDALTRRADPAHQGQRFQRVFQYVSPGTTIADLSAVHQRALAELSKLSQPTGAISRERFAAIIAADITQYAELLANHSSLGAAFFADEPIEQWCIIRYDGNSRVVAYQTATTWGLLQYLTS